ncbi:MAG: hypothetical protein GF334_10400 [Candidatus Altiarchaeales archaeon]|nr:hypothetical protein [Candidatus Altiarchaeales archaeon]
MDEMEEKIAEVGLVGRLSAVKKAYKAERAEWIREHGSDRLKKALELNLLDKSDGLYKDERLGKEFPGWRWVEEIDEGGISEIRNPTLQALESFEEALEQEVEEPTLSWLEADKDGYKGAVVEGVILGEWAFIWADDPIG